MLRKTKKSFGLTKILGRKKGFKAGITKSLVSFGTKIVTVQLTLTDPTDTNFLSAPDGVTLLTSP